MADDELERSRAEFEAKVRAATRPRAREATGGAVGGKGSPPALLTIGAIGTATLGLCAALLGGGLLFVPATIPLGTVLAVLASRAWAQRR